MKFKRILLIPFLLLSFFTYSTEVSREDLEKLNNFITTLLKQQHHDHVKIKLTDVERREDGSISHLAVAGEFDELRMRSSVILYDKMINFSFSVAGNINKFGANSDFESFVKSTKLIFDRYVNKLNERELYEVKSTTLEDEDNVFLSFKMMPKDDDFVSGDILTGLVEFKRETNRVVISIGLRTNVHPEVAKKGKVSLTNIINSLFREELPQALDMNSFFEVFNIILKSLK